MKFTKWFPFDTAPEHTGPVIYEIRLTVDAKPVAIGRFGGTDQNGQLVIGSTTNLLKRWYQSRTAWQKGYGSSTMNWGFYLERYTSFRRRYPNAVLEYRFAVAETGGEAKSWEAQSIRAYWQRFFEPPPLNCVTPNRYGEYEEPDDGTPT